MRLVKPWASLRVSRLALVAISAVLAVSGCSVFGTSGSGQNGGQLTVGVVPGIDNTPLQVGVQDGLFRDQGLNVVVKTFSSLQPELQALKNGGVDIAAGDYADLFYEAVTGHASLHLVADGYDAAPNVVEVLTLPGSGITTPQQLEHKVVATPEPQLIPSFNGSYLSDVVPYSSETLATDAVLASDGVDPSTLSWRPMPTKNMIAELQSGHVSAILAPQPVVIEAESQLGALEVMDSYSGPTANLPLSGYFSLGAFASAHSSQLQQFQRALASAQANAANGGPLQTMLPQLTGMSAQDAALLTLGSFPTSLAIGQIQRVADLMYDSGLISSPLSVSSLASG
jgi:NitT/TauT family transport system substrate-binding protein